MAAIKKVIKEHIAADPLNPLFRQGNTLGEENKHWFRAKFLQQFRLFFRFSETKKIIVIAWVNDTHHLRAYDSKTDAYKIFAKMLAEGHPPGDWETLLSQAKVATAQIDPQHFPDFS